MNFSFAGCGFLGIYHVGVAACLKKYAPNLLVNKISGASAGALAAVCLLCDSPLGTITTSILKTATEARRRLLGPFSPTFNVEKLLTEGLLSVLPPDAHKIVSGKLFISVTRISDGKNILLSQFDTREELVSALLCSAFIPGFSGWLPLSFRGVRYIDGGFTDNLPVLDENTITVSPFSGDSDICPRDTSTHFMQAILCSCFIPGFSGWIPPQFKGVRYVDGFCSNNLPVLDDQTVTVSPFAGNSDICPIDHDDKSYVACICSAFIPGFSGWAPPTVRGVRYIDGGFTDNLPEVDVHTVTVSPFGGEADICPKDNTAGLLTISLANTSIELSKENLYRFARILFPPPPQVLNKMCQQGFNDALDFLNRSNLINCMRCLSVTSKFKIPHSQEEVNIGIDDDDDCLDCHKQRKEAIIDQLPEQVGSILQDAIDKANQGLMNWVFKHKSMKLLSIITLPYVLPIDIAYAVFLKFSSSTPSTYDIKVIGKQIVELVQALLSSIKHSEDHNHHKDKFSCQLAITEFAGDNESQQVNRRHDFDFTVDMADVGVPHSQNEAMLLHSEALTQVALRCASRCVSRAGSRMGSRMGSRVASRAASRAVSRAVSRMPSLDDLTDPSNYGSPAMFEGPGHITDDAFDQILDVTTHQEALMAYYYLDDNNEVQVTEIFDMTNDGHCGLEVDDSHHLSVTDAEFPRWSLSRCGSDCSLADNCEAGGSLLSDADSENYHRCDNEPDSEHSFPVSPSQLKINLRNHARAVDEI